MKGKLNNKSTFGQIKKWFKENAKELPTTLDSDCIYYNNVPNTVEICIRQVEFEIERLGAENIKKSAVGKASKNNLLTLYKSLQNVDLWNAPKPTLNSLNQRINA
jgi:hypothetical protein